MTFDIKTLQLKEDAADKIVYVAVSGKLEKEDFETFVPDFDVAERDEAERWLKEDI